MSGSIFQATTQVSIGERDGQVTVTFLRTSDLSDPVNITYDVTSESATPGADFTGGSGTVLMAAGASSTTVTFPIINDALSEATETLIVSLVGVDSGAISLPRTTRVNILDDENPVLPPTSPPLVSDYRVIKETAVSDLIQPIKFEFSPVDPDLAYVADKVGVISIVNVATGADVGVLLDIRSQVNDYGDHGLYDIAFHPDFANNPYLYAFYVVEPPDATAAMQDTIGNRYAHVVRYTLAASQTYEQIIPGSAVVLIGGAGQSTADINGGGLLNFQLPTYSNRPSSERYLDPAGGDIAIGGIKQDYIKVDGPSHVGGSLAFGPDGMLYISIGDGGSPNYADPHNADVQNLNSLSGKILRVDPLTGDGLTDNPFYQVGQSLDSNIAKVYQYGLRNPFSIAFDSLGRLFIADTGWNAYEEINTGPAGTNFGWPWYEGREGGVLAKTSGYQSLAPAAPFYAAVESGAIHVAAPYNAFGHAESAPGFQNQVITGGDVIYTGGRYPVEFQGDYFFTDFFNGSTFVIDSNNRLDVKFLFPSEGQYAPVHFVQGADGYVYYSELFGPDFSAGSVGRLHIFSESDNLLVNGSFEQPVVPVGSSNFDAVTGWTAITGGKIEIWKAHNGVVASDGANFLELDYLAAQDGFFQDVQTEAGETYTLAFDLRTRLPAQPTSTQAVEVVWNGVVVDTVTPASAAWESVVVSLVGTGGLDRLTIREVASQGADGRGAMLDHFGLYPAGDAPAPPPPPEPPTPPPSPPPPPEPGGGRRERGERGDRGDTGGTAGSTINGSDGNDTLTGGRRADAISGVGGDDILHGRDGIDTLNGGDGNDWLFGDAGADMLTGGTGHDVFAYTTASAKGDTITDFKQNGQADRIDLAEIDRGVLAFTGAATTTVSAHSVNWYETGGNTIVQADVNGRAGVDFQITLIGTGLNLTAADFVL